MQPFDKYNCATDDEIVETLKSIGLGKRDVSDVIFDERTVGLSPSVLSLLRRMLDPDPEKRMTAEKFRRNRWVQGLTASWDVLERSDKRLELYWQRELRKSISKKFGDCLDEDKLREVFQQIDSDGNGKLDFNTLSKEEGYSQHLKRCNPRQEGWNIFRRVQICNFVKRAT